MPVGTGDCVMNKICKRFEQEFDGYIRKHNSKIKFDYTIMKNASEDYTTTQYKTIKKLYEDYNKKMQSYQPHDIVHSDNDLLVSLNDIHYGANVHNAWNVYNSDICAEMMRSYLDRIIEIGKRHSSENCIVWANGDLISGNIHYSIAVTNKENVIQQITGVSELIATFLAELSEHFSTVSFISVAGNHSRISPNKENSLHTERLDDLVEWYIKARLQNFKNVFVMNDKIDETMYTIDIRGKTYLGIHGDYDGSAAKVQSLQTLAGKPVYAILSGHLHHNRVESIQGIKTVMAGSFMGVDDFCVQKRIYGTPEQMVCVCDDTGIVCHYDIDLKTT